MLQGPCQVVQATPPIRARFDATFPTVEHDVAIGPTDDRLGVGLHGPPGAVERLESALVDVGIDVFAWTDDAPLGAVFDAEVTEPLGSGAVVDLGPREGFLPYDAVDGYIDDGDRVTVQVHEPAPPWTDHRPEVGDRLQVDGGLATLIGGLESPRAEVRDDERAAELVRSVDLLSTETPDGWGVRWEPGAAEADLEALDDALAAATERVGALEAHLEGGDPPGTSAWVRFGRAARFALDEHRSSVTATMPGHHRIKAGGGSASAAVDLVEQLGASADGFPFEAVADTFGPAVGDALHLDHGKPDGRRFSLGQGDVIDRDGETVTIRREMTGGGEYDALGVPREAGDVAVTKLAEGRWWYPTVYRDAEGNSKGTYVNVCTPVEVFPEGAAYVDLHVDVVRHADGTVERVDDDELDVAVEAGHVAPDLAAKARQVAASVERGLS